MKYFNVARKYGAKVVAATSLALVGTAAMAADGDNPIIVLIDSIGLTGVTAAIAALCLVVVAIALTFKGPDVAKRVIRKI